MQAFQSLQKRLQEKLPELDYSSMKLLRRKDAFHHFSLFEKFLFCLPYLPWHIPDYFILLDGEILFFERWYNDGCGDMGGGWDTMLMAKRGMIEVVASELANLAPLYS